MKNAVTEFQTSLTARPFLLCGGCECNLLAFKPKLQKTHPQIQEAMKGTPVVGQICQRYFEDDDFFDSIIESTLCPHKFHLSCFVKKVRSFRGAVLRWKCVQPYCPRYHDTATQYIVRKRTDYLVALYDRPMVPIYGKYFYFLCVCL